MKPTLSSAVQATVASTPTCIASVGIIKPPIYSAGFSALVSSKRPIVPTPPASLTVFEAYKLDLMNRELSDILTKAVCFSLHAWAPSDLPPITASISGPRIGPPPSVENEINALSTTKTLPLER
jgi:hypothetical protein